MSKQIQGTHQDIDVIFNPATIRARSEQLFEYTLAGKTSFTLNLDRLESTTQYVLDVTNEHYPDGKIPYHSRWGHFNMGGVNRLEKLNQHLNKLLPSDRVRVLWDLVIVSVLLDAGAGPDWSYRENGQCYNRSEGLAIASLQMFLDGQFSNSKEDQYCVHAKKLTQLKAEDLAQGFQVTGSNPLVGLSGRLELLHNLGELLCENESWSGGDEARPSDLYNTFNGLMSIKAKDLLKAVLTNLGPIWPGRLYIGEQNLGDVWTHPLLGNEHQVKSLVPFHKLSQWLTYSLLEPLEAIGVYIEQIDDLTGLPEYRNGGLFIDTQVLSLKNPDDLSKSHLPSSPLIVEWRALTICLLDRLGESVRKHLGRTSDELPLTKVLQGGSWNAGRKQAFALRKNGEPPLKIQSDGTVF